MFIFVTCDVSPFAGFAWFLARAVLKILPFDPMMSDVHCGIFISLSCRPDEHLIMNEQIENVNTTIHRATKDVSKQDSFLLKLDNDDITQFINHMDSLDGNYTKMKLIY